MNRSDPLKFRSVAWSSGKLYAEGTNESCYKIEIGSPNKLYWYTRNGSTFMGDFADVEEAMKKAQEHHKG